MDHTTKDPTIRALKQAAAARAHEAERRPPIDPAPGAPDDGSDDLSSEILRPFDGTERDRLFAGLSARVEQQARRRRASRIARIGMPVLAMAAAATLIFRGGTAGTHFFEFEPPRGDAAPEHVTLSTTDARFTRRLIRLPGVDKKDGFELVPMCTQDKRWLPCAIERDESNAAGDIIIQGRRDALFPGELEGQWDLCIFIARRGHMPPQADLQEAGCEHPGPRRGYQALRLTMVLGRAR